MPKGSTGRGTRAAQRAAVPARGVTKKAGPRAFRLDPARLAAARQILGTPNDTATIDAALDLVVFGHELRAGVDALRTMTFESFDCDEE